MTKTLVVLLVFVFVPLLEIGLFIQLGGWLGLFPTLGLILLTAVIGVALLKLQGLLTLARVREKLDRGEIPALDLAEGIILLVAAVLLLTPGFFTDALGFLCLLPAFRRILATYLLTQMVLRRRQQGEDITIIEGEVVSTRETPPDQLPPDQR